MASKSIITVLLISFFFSCNRKQLNVPLSYVNGETEIYDNSPVWFFKEGDSIYINKGGLISSTNWFFAIEKELPLKLIIPNVEKLRLKKKKNIHAKEGTFNYYIYSDTVVKKNSFFKFNAIKYQFVANTAQTDSLHIIITTDKNIVKLNGNEINKKNILAIASKSITNSDSKISLYFSQNTNFQEYLDIVLPLYKIARKLDETQYILP